MAGGGKNQELLAGMEDSSSEEEAMCKQGRSGREKDDGDEHQHTGLDYCSSHRSLNKHQSN